MNSKSRKQTLVDLLRDSQRYTPDEVNRGLEHIKNNIDNVRPGLDYIGYIDAWDQLRAIQFIHDNITIKEGALDEPEE